MNSTSAAVHSAMDAARKPSSERRRTSFSSSTDARMMNGTLAK